jgi:hypothetical protein
MIDFDPNTADPIEYLCNAGKAIYFLFCLDHNDYYEDGGMPNISDVRVEIQNSVYRFEMELKSCLQNIVNNKYFNVFLADNAKFLITDELDTGKGEPFFRSLFCSEDERVCALNFALWLSSECIMPEPDDEDSGEEVSEDNNLPENLISIADKM